MPIPQPKLLRLAGAIRDRLIPLHTSRYGDVIRRTHDLLDDFADLRRQSDLLAVCLGWGWLTAAENVADRIALNLRNLPYYATQLGQSVDACKTSLPAVREVLTDLQQAADEFEDIHFDDEADELVVTTEPIELDHTYLGPFEIRLHVPAIADCQRSSSIYRIVALDPHPAASNESVTHPHVNDERLCEGDAGAAINAALTTGRVCDFFHLIHAVLTTYNPDSPYVSLDNWEGRPCYDCGYIMSEDDTCWCRACENEFCGECISYCRRCNDSICLGCLEECTVCGEKVCTSCKTTCPNCGRMLCTDCLEERQCPCIEERQEQENENDTDQQDRPAEGGSDQTPGRTEPSRQAGIEAA